MTAEWPPDPLSGADTGAPPQPTFKARLLAAIGVAAKGELEEALDRLWTDGGLTVGKAPEAGLVMATVRDPFDVAFYLGEVLLTRAEVDFEGQVGHGSLLGDNPEGALLLAAAEALERKGGGDRLACLAPLLERLANRDAKRRQDASRLSAATVVRFETLQPERIDFGSLGG
jgi:phosphonate C-P lyase system protein PhnG